ncbi:tol-pal system protein YbgF [Rhodobacteraceae bacterium N5(2021)]|uniref:Cell division coordinator CpoB n=1 Tax=Gymnodinialimonas phycosphaerae TaxID=2841589 RepID=A0A975TU93_9RHOB|nr:tol-pal system protein YbgF [Gymnodinialimonas phycosphaerae]MBY4895018.1 tol-pal system protein YbgF [Gymnodinialimonas phycosphaerae]
MRLALAVCCALIAGPAVAQDNAQTLADIRQELSVLYVEIQRLRGELNTTGGASGSGASGSMLDRVNAIEAEVTRLTSLTERLQLDVDNVVRDGTNRIGDLEFRLCELEPSCDIASLGETPSLGGVVPTSNGTAGTLPQVPAGPSTPAPTGLAVAEQADFDRANAAFEAGDFADAVTGFQTFVDTYPGSPLSADAHYLRGEAEANLGRWNPAARAFLAAFSAGPDGPRAPIALTSLGVALAQIGQPEEACLTLAEVAVRFPGSASVAEAQSEMGRLGCQ